MSSAIVRGTAWREAQRPSLARSSRAGRTLPQVPRGDLLGDGAGGGGADHPLQVGGLEGDQDHADLLRQLPEALGVHEMVGGLAPDVGLKPLRGGLAQRGGGGGEGYTSRRGHRFCGSALALKGPPSVIQPQLPHLYNGAIKAQPQAFVTFFSLAISSEPNHGHQCWPPVQDALARSRDEPH